MGQEWGALAQTLGFPTAALVIVVSAFVRGWVVPGYVYRDCQKREERFTALALRNAETARGSVGLAERTVAHHAAE